MAFDKPQSRNEAILQNMLGANNELEPPKSRVEALLQDIAGKMPEANPSEGTTTGTLERLKIGDDIYSVEGGGSGTSDYDALNNKPQIAGTTLSGNKSLADLGIASASAVSGILDGTDIDSFGDVETALGDKVDKVSGKGLSTNDYDDTEKAAVTAATTAIDGIKDGTDIDSFADVETALADKVDKVAGKGLSTNDYTNEDKAIVGGVTAALGGKADTDIVASDFSTSASYTAGDYCIYEGKFYKFKANHSGAWSAADVDEIKIAGELASLKSGLTNYENQNNLNLEVPDRKNLSVSQQNNTDLAHLSAGTYTISYKGNFKMNLDVNYDDESSWTRIVENVYAPQTFVLSKAGTVNLNAFSNDIYDIQIEKGSTATAYTPYIPSVESRIEAVESGFINLTSNTTTALLEGHMTQSGACYYAQIGKVVFVIANLTKTEASWILATHLPRPKFNACVGVVQDGTGAIKYPVDILDNDGMGKIRVVTGEAFSDYNVAFSYIAL